MEISDEVVLKKATIVRWNSVPLFNNKDALLFVDYLEQMDCRLWGFDGFAVTDEYIMPYMDYILDCLNSDNAPRHVAQAQCFKVARTILAEPGAQDLFFEFVIGDD
ncbi:hypothetical protein [Desulfovibrio cuneatus]|uniref:hypothetical protein n=1 Tax=Desulfovibrio cuneatus TaxID=159728 RepID=UPI00041FF38A|nr:hypothetical protein [Desulfovibrio cuneatus]